MKKLKIWILSLALVVGVAAVFLCIQRKPAEHAVTFKVNIHCANCKANLERHILFEKGVTEMETDIRAQTVRITYEPRETDETTLRSAIEQLGFKVGEIVNH